MIIVVDANIIISGIINPYGAIPELILLKSPEIEFVIPDYTISEIQAHKNRICKELTISPSVFNHLLEALLSNILVFSSETINQSTINNAIELVRGIDEKDALYIAFCFSLSALLWTGDLKLYRGLRKKGFNSTITTSELKQIIKGL